LVDTGRNAKVGFGEALGMSKSVRRFLRVQIKGGNANSHPFCDVSIQRDRNCLIPHRSLLNFTSVCGLREATQSRNVGYTHGATHMTLNIRNQEADNLARQLARIDRTSITDAVISALRETIRNRMNKESPRETARKILAKHGLSFPQDRKPVPPGAYHDLDHDLQGGE
jgi:antitoxin VapB